jgi:hypothetical protein
VPLAYEVFAGNRNDVTTVEEIITLMEEKYGKAKRIWVMDRGMVSQENFEFLRQRGAQYIVGTPKAQLRQFEKELLQEEDWTEVREQVEVKLLPTLMEKGLSSSSCAARPGGRKKGRCWPGRKPSFGRSSWKSIGAWKRTPRLPQ